MGVLVNTHITPVRQPQEGRNEELPFGTRGGLEIDGYFPLDGEYEFKVETAGARRDVHQLEISIDGERKAIRTFEERSGSCRRRWDGTGIGRVPFRGAGQGREPSRSIR